MIKTKLNSEFFKEAMDEQQKTSAILNGWVSLVKDYTRRKVTRPSDKLVAIYGLAELIAEGADHL